MSLPSDYQRIIDQLDKKLANAQSTTEYLEFISDPANLSWREFDDKRKLSMLAKYHALGNVALIDLLSRIEAIIDVKAGLICQYGGSVKFEDI